MKAILLSRDGFWTERVVDAAPPIYRVPWTRPQAFEPDVESSAFMPSYGTIDFERISLDLITNVAVYLQVNGL